MKAHICNKPIPPDNRTEKEKQESRKKAIKLLSAMFAVNAVLQNTPYNNDKLKG